MPPRLIVEVVGDTSQLERSYKRASKATDVFGRSVRNTSRGVVSATASFTGLRRAMLSTSAAFIGGAGIVAAFTSTIKAAEESQRVLAQTRVAVKNSGIAWGEHARQIEAATAATSKLSAFDDEKLLGTFSNLIRRTGDVNEALRLNALAANVARGRNIDLEAASQLVLKASIGNVGALRRLGINIDKNATSTEALALLQRKYAGSAEAYGRTAAGAQDRFRVAIENLQEAVGKQLLPTISTYLNKGADWLNQSKNQQRIVGAVRSAVKTLSDVIAALTPIVKTVVGAVESFTDAVGGAKNAIKLLIAVTAGWKIAKLGADLAGASGQAGGLRTRLLALTRMGPIAIPVVIGVSVLMNKGAIDEAVTGWLKGHGLGGLTGGNINARSVSGANKILQSSMVPGWVKDVVRKGIASQPGLGRGLDQLEAGRITGQPTPATFGISGGATAGHRPRKPMAARGLDAFITHSTQLALATARSEVQQRAALGRELEDVNKALRKRLNFADKLALEQEKTQILDQIKSMNEAEASARQRGVDAATAARKRAAADRKAAAAKEAREERKRMALLVAGLRLPKLGVKGGPLTLADVRKAVAGHEQAAQFRALGLTATGDALTPTRKGLLRIADKLSRDLRGTPLDTDKNRNMIARARKVLTDQLTIATLETRRKVKELFDALSGNDQKEPDLNKIRAVSQRRLAAMLGTGLTPAARARLASNIAGANLTTGGRGQFALNNYTTVTLDGRAVGRSVQKNAAAAKHRTARQTSGWQGG